MLTQEPTTHERACAATTKPMEMNAMKASSISGKAHRDRIRRDSFDKPYNDANTGYSVPQPAANAHNMSPSYSQDYAGIRQQSPWQEFATSSNKPKSRAYSRLPREQGSGRRKATVEPELQAVDPDPQRDGPTFALGTTLGKSPINKTFTTDNSINNSNNLDNRVDNGHIEIGNSSSNVSAATMTYANDITHFNIGTIQYHVFTPPEYLNPRPPLNNRGSGGSRNRVRKRRSKPRPKNKSRAM